MSRILLDSVVARRMASQTRKLSYTDKCLYFPPRDMNDLDDAGHPKESITFTEVVCALNDTVARLQAESRWNDFAVLTEIIAEIHVSSIVPMIGGQFELIERSHIPLNDTVKYEILAIRNQGAFGYLCALKTVSI